MNRLSFVTDRDWYGLRIILLVDDTPIRQLVERDDRQADGGIPAWLLTEGLPTCDANGRVVIPGATASDCVGPIGTLVAACGCGEPGCGHLRCELRRHGEQVVLESFIWARNRQRWPIRLTFGAVAFDSVVAEITELARPDAAPIKPE